MVLGQSIDQSSVLGERDLRKRRFWRCSRKIGTLQFLSIQKSMRLQDTVLHVDTNCVYQVRWLS